MKKYFFYGCTLALAAVMMSSCKSSKESAYRDAYNQAVAARPETEVTPVQQTSPVEVTPVTTTPQKTIVEDVNVRSENVKLVSGTGLKTYSVVVGSFGVQANAERQQADLKRTGYDAQIVLNPTNNMYRVVASTFNDKSQAIQSRDQLRQSVNSDAWLLYTK